MGIMEKFAHELNYTDMRSFYGNLDLFVWVAVILIVMLLAYLRYTKRIISYNAYKWLCIFFIALTGVSGSFRVGMEFIPNVGITLLACIVMYFVIESVEKIELQKERERQDRNKQRET